MPSHDPSRVDHSDSARPPGPPRPPVALPKTLARTLVAASRVPDWMASPPHRGGLGRGAPLVGAGLAVAVVGMIAFMAVTGRDRNTGPTTSPGQHANR